MSNGGISILSFQRLITLDNDPIFVFASDTDSVTYGVTLENLANAIAPFVNNTFIWGSITGTLSNQADLNSALGTKLNLSGGTLSGSLAGTTFTGTSFNGVELTATGIAGLFLDQTGAYSTVDWGEISGLLSNQGDLQAALNAKLSLTGGALTGPLTSSSTFAGTSFNSVALTAAGSAANFLNETGAYSVPPKNPFPANLVIINQESNFPTQDGTTITLEQGINYLLTTDISSSKRFVYQTGSLFTANNQFGAKWTYTGTGNMFTGNNVNVTLSNITFDCPTGTFIDHTDSVGGVDIIVLDLVNVISCVKFGTIRDSLAIRINTSFSVSASDGLTITGTTNNNLVIRQFALFSTSATFIGLDLGSAVTKFEVKDLLFIAPAGAIGISGLANSANIPANNIAMLTGSDFSGGMSNFNVGGITADDIRWSYGENNTIPDTNPDLLLSLTGNSTATTVSGGTPALLAGTWNSVERASQFSGTTAGRGTFLGERTLAGPVDISVTVEPASGSNKVISAYVAVDGTFVANSKTSVKVDSGNGKTISIPWQTDFSNATFVEIFVSNDTDNISVLGTSAILRVR